MTARGQGYIELASAIQELERADHELQQLIFRDRACLFHDLSVRLADAIERRSKQLRQILAEALSRPPGLQVVTMNADKVKPSSVYASQVMPLQLFDGEAEEKAVDCGEVASDSPLLEGGEKRLYLRVSDWTAWLRDFQGGYERLRARSIARLERSPYWTVEQAILWIVTGSVAEVARCTCEDSMGSDAGEDYISLSDIENTLHGGRLYRKVANLPSPPIRYDFWDGLHILEAALATQLTAAGVYRGDGPIQTLAGTFKIKDRKGKGIAAYRLVDEDWWSDIIFLRTNLLKLWQKAPEGASDTRSETPFWQIAENHRPITRPADAESTTVRRHTSPE